MRTTVLLIVCLLLPLCCFAQDIEMEPVPQSISDMYSWFYLSIASNDLATATSYMSLLAQVQSQMQGLGGEGDVMRLGETMQITDLEPVFVWWKVEGDRALVEYDLHITGFDKQSGEAIDETWARLDTLTRKGTSWQIREYVRLELEQQDQDIIEKTVRSEQSGITFTVPEKWLANVIKHNQGYAYSLHAPDLATSVSVLAQELPMRLTAQEAVEMDTKALSAPEIKQEPISSTEATVAGVPGWQGESTLTIGDATIFMRRLFRIDEYEPGKYVLFCMLLTADDAQQAAGWQQDWDSILNSLEIDKFTPPAIPPELGRIEGNRYINDVNQVQMDIPEGWTSSIGKLQGIFSLTLTSPDSNTTVILVCLNVGQYVDPKLIAQSSAASTEIILEDVQTISEGEIQCADQSGYEMVFQGQMAGKHHQRRDIFFMRDILLFAVVVDTNEPETNYEAVKPAVDAAIASLSLSPILE